MVESAPQPEESPLRAAILDAARSLLVSHGLRDFSLRQVARSVGRSATAIYLHFEGKDALVHALIDEGFESLKGEVLRSSARETAPLARLRAACRKLVT